MRTPLSYYGGKQQLAKTILGLIPEHRVYCEPFLGGAAIFFAKNPSPVEIINDTNGEIINFYEALRQDFPALEKEVAVSLHSRRQHRHAEIIYQNPDMFDPIKRAWAVWMLANASYGHMLDGGIGYDRNGKRAGALDNKRQAFSVDYAARLQNAQIECRDALQIIETRDAADAFFYLDPPYVGTNQGHYDGYSQADFDALLELLETIQGKFLLSSYRNKNLSDFSTRNGWHTIEIRMTCSMTTKSGKPRKKIEVLTANYPISIAFDEHTKKEVVNKSEES